MAIKSQSALVKVSTAEAAAKVITAITAANPPVVSSTAHGYANGDIVRIDSVVGMDQVNGRSFVVGSSAANTFELKGVDGTGYSAYTSGGNAYKQTLVAIAEVVGIDQSGGEADEIDVTHLRSVAKEYLLGLQNFGTYSMSLNIVAADAGQTRLRALKESGAQAAFSVQTSDLKVMAFQAFVKSFDFSNPTNDALRGTCQLRVTGAPAYFA